jgi:hypothetical protein
MTLGRKLHTSTLFPSGPLQGKVLIAGGYGGAGGIVGPLADAIIYDPATGMLTSTANTMRKSRYGHTATFLDPAHVTGRLAGKVLITGGTSIVPQDSAEIFDPDTESFTALGATMKLTRTFQTATLLTSGLLAGQVLIGGGQNAIIPFHPDPCINPNGIDNCAELFDPVSETFNSTTGKMTVGREHQVAALLTSGSFTGEVLFAGGDDGASALSTTELYDPASDSFMAEQPLKAARDYLAGTLLSSGNQLLLDGGAVNIGGTSNQPGGVPALDSADVASGPSTQGAGAMSVARENQTATLITSGLLAGKVLIAGGDSGNSATPAILSSAELFDPALTRFTPTASMGTARRYHSATLLLNGQVLIVGGETSASALLDTTELYSP